MPSQHPESTGGAGATVAARKALRELTPAQRLSVLGLSDADREQLATEAHSELCSLDSDPIEPDQESDYCPASKEGGGHCNCWWHRASPCCWCGDAAVEDPAGLHDARQVLVGDALAAGSATGTAPRPRRPHELTPRQIVALAPSRQLSADEAMAVDRALERADRDRDRRALAERACGELGRTLGRVSQVLGEPGLEAEPDILLERLSARLRALEPELAAPPAPPDAGPASRTP